MTPRQPDWPRELMFANGGFDGQLRFSSAMVKSWLSERRVPGASRQ